MGRRLISHFGGRRQRGWGHGPQMLRDGPSVSETAYASGFNDVSHFRNCFKEEFGMSPKQYAKGETPADDT